MTDIGDEKPCECRFRNGVQVKECKFHKKQFRLIRQRLAEFLEARLNLIFRKTFLVEIRDEVIKEIKRIRPK